MIEVSGRTYPVEVLYRPLAREGDDEDDVEIEEGILDAVDELARIGPGDILVFLPGGARSATQPSAAQASSQGRGILPLYARLSFEGRRAYSNRAANAGSCSRPRGGDLAPLPGGITWSTRACARQPHSSANKVEQLRRESLARLGNQRGALRRVAAGCASALRQKTMPHARVHRPEILRSSRRASSCA